MKVLHLRAMAMCLWGGDHTFVFGSGTKLFEKVPGFLAGVLEFKTILKVPGFHFFFNPSFLPEVSCDITPIKLFFENGRLLMNSSVSKLYCTFDLNLQPPNLRQTHRDFWWANQPILWLR